MREIFFGDKGLTSTSANHIANIAKEYCDTISKSIESLNFVTEETTLLGGERTVVTSVGQTDLNFKEKLDIISQCHSLIAWLREAIKEKTAMTDKATNLTLEQYLKEKGIKHQHPAFPEDVKEWTKDDVINTWDINKVQSYLSLEAYVSTYGKFVHPNGSFNVAKKNLNKIANAAYKVFGEGRETVVKHYTPSVSIQEVDDAFFALQKEYREKQARFNTYNFEIEEAIKEHDLKANLEYKKKLKEYEDECDKYYREEKSYMAELSEHIINEKKRINALKIVIPANLKDVYERISKLGDESSKS